MKTGISIVVLRRRLKFTESHQFKFIVFVSSYFETVVKESEVLVALLGRRKQSPVLKKFAIIQNGNVSEVLIIDWLSLEYFVLLHDLFLLRFPLVK